jgi:membrane protein
LNSAFTTLVSRDFLRRLWKKANEDDIFGRSAQLSYYFLLALFPFLLFLVTLFGYFSDASSELRRELIAYLSSVVPSSAVRLVVATIDEVTQARGGGKLS